MASKIKKERMTPKSRRAANQRKLRLQATRAKNNAADIAAVEKELKNAPLHLRPVLQEKLEQLKLFKELISSQQSAVRHTMAADRRKDQETIKVRFGGKA